VQQRATEKKNKQENKEQNSVNQFNGISFSDNDANLINHFVASSFQN